MPVECSLVDGVIELLNPFEGSRYPAQGDALSITFRSLRLPNSQRPILGIGIESWDLSGNEYFLVDEYTDVMH